MMMMNKFDLDFNNIILFNNGTSGLGFDNTQ
jgi:hypothetical protein